MSAATVPSDTVPGADDDAGAEGREWPEAEAEDLQPRPPHQPRLDCTRRAETGYRKGRRFAIDVVTIDGRDVEVRTADAYWAMQQAAAADGVSLPIYSGFRSHAEQEYFYRCYETCACNECRRAAKPGYSKHHSGRALDIGQWEGMNEWLVANAKRFRFFATVKSEPWHWEFKPPKRRRFEDACAEDSATSGDR